MSKHVVVLANLPDNWDSYGASSVSLSIANAALCFVESVSTSRTPQPAIVPTNDGKLQVEWHTQGIDLEVKIISQSAVSYSLEDSRGDFPSVEERELRYDLTDLQRAIMRLTARANVG